MCHDGTMREFVTGYDIMGMSVYSVSNRRSDLGCAIAVSVEMLVQIVV